MNLFIIAALVAVCGAAKLDRTYLPPASAKTAGGSPGSLQTPLLNSIGNNGLGGLPKGSFTNEFDGVVVDAAAAGTRASGNGVSGLGAPRKAYGSTNSKVGEAAFKTNPNAFIADGQAGASNDQTGQFQPGDSNFQTGVSGQASGQNFLSGANTQNNGPERPRAALDRAANTLRFESEVGPESYRYAFETDNGIVAEENGVATNGVQAQGGYSYTGDDGQVYSVSYTADEGGYQPKGDHLPTPPPIPEEILKSLEQNARDEAAGLVDDGSYDAQKYNAGSDYSESDNANGKYSHQSSKFGQPDATASGSFISQTNQAFRPGQSAKGQTSLGSSAQQSLTQGQNYQGFEQGEGNTDASGLAEQSTNEDHSATPSNRFGSATGQTSTGQQPQGSSNRFGVNASGSFGSNGNGQNQRPNSASAQIQMNTFGVSTNTHSSQGNINDYLPPTGSNRPQNGRPQKVKPQADSSSDSTNQFTQETDVSEDDSAQSIALSQQKLQQQKQPLGVPSTSYNQPISGVSGQINFGSNAIQSGIRPSNGKTPNRFSQTSQFSQASASFGNKNEYLPPKQGFNQNRPLNRPSTSLNSGSQFNQQAVDIDSSSNPETGSQSISTTVSQSAFGSQQSNGFGRPQPGFTSSISNGRFPSSQNNLGFNSQKATSQPDTELTTPFESSADSSSAQSSETPTPNNVPFGSRPSNGRRPQSKPGNQYYQSSAPTPTQPSSSASQSVGTQSVSRPQTPGSRPLGQTQAPAFPTRPSIPQLNQNAQISQQYQDVQNNNAQISPESRPFGQTQAPAFPTRPTTPQFNQNSQISQELQFVQTNDAQFSPGSRPLGQTQAPAFPTRPSTSQFNQNSQIAQQYQGVQTDDAQFSPSTQRPIFAQQQQGPDDSYYYNQPSQPFNTPQFSRFPSAPSGQFDRVTQGSSFSQSNGQFNNAPNNNIQGSSRYPRPPTVAPTAFAPTSTQSQYQSSGFNGITQASISPFPSQTPTQSSQFNDQTKFGSNQFSGSRKPSFGQQTTSAQSTFSQQPASQRPTKRPISSQGTDISEQQQPTIATQQYSGEIYEYTKPTQTLPAPEKTASISGQFGQKVQTGSQSRPQAEPDNEDAQTTNVGLSQTTQTQTQFGAKPSRLQFGQNNFAVQSTQQQSNFGSRPQFGQPAKAPQATFATETGTNDETEVQKNTENQDINAQFGFGRPCCQSTKPNSGSLPSRQNYETTRPNFGAQPTRPSFGSQNQFGVQSTSIPGVPSTSFPGVQSTSFPGVQSTPFPGVPSTSFTGVQGGSFAGKGEVFDASRKPPATSFDSETGYHY